MNIALTLYGMEYFSSTLAYRVQKTLRRSISFRGVGLHTGCQSTVVLRPASVNQGILFELWVDEKVCKVSANYESVVATEMATTLGWHGNPSVRVATVEHLLSALFAMGVTNIIVEVQGPEIPILDGSAIAFVEGILDAGIKIQPYSTSTLKILKPIRILRDGAACELLPRDRLRLTASIDFGHKTIGLQTYGLDITPGIFRDQIGRARTFGFLGDLDRLRQSGFARGACLENVLAFEDEGILNPEGARFSDECVRHKVMDALGDLALCGSWIEGELVSYRGGHSIHLSLLKSLKDFRSHWEVIPAEPLKLPWLETQVMVGA